MGFVQPIAQITGPELKQRLDRGDDIVLLDVREADEVTQASLGGTHIPMGELAQRVSELDPAKEIVVLCHHGIRSAYAAHFLRDRGFTKVSNLVGGIDGWSQRVDPKVPRYWR